MKMEEYGRKFTEKNVCLIKDEKRIQWFVKGLSSFCGEKDKFKDPNTSTKLCRRKNTFINGVRISYSSKKLGWKMYSSSWYLSISYLFAQ